jgi:YD repeat-containing protein
MPLFLIDKFGIMKKLFTIGILISISSQCIAQYYYSDIIGTQQTNKQYKTLIAQQLKKISATSYEANNQPSRDFLLDQLIDNNKQQVITHSKSSTNGESYFISHYHQNRLVKTVDSGSSAINTVQYQYATDGKIKSINSINKDFDGTLRSNEVHTWFYNAAGQPEKMLRIKNNVDTTHVSFTYDEAGNIAEEIWKKKNRTLETYYYYYNAKNLLTDIVRYSKKAKQMLPDFILEYDDKGRVIQMTQTQSASANYLVWRYAYNPQGLKTREMVYNKQKEFLGKIEYTYQ